MNTVIALQRPLAQLLLAMALCVALAHPLAANEMPKSELPDIGAPWDSTLSRAQSYQIGRM
ncbi:MAG: hypothetical protein AAFX85_20320, partial [Pseudomonadota bacterium]